jgi:hypothetical protein
MDKRVAILKTPEECERFVVNAVRLQRPDLAQEARRHAVQLRAQVYGSESDVEREALEAVYAYEAVLTRENGKKTRASRTWQLIRRHGVLQAVERTINKDEETADYATLVEMGLERYAFEAVVMRYPDSFSAETVEHSRERAAQRQSA